MTPMIRTLIVSLALLTTSAAAPADALLPNPIRPTPIPIALFADRPFITMPVLSPDGKRIAAITRIGSEDRLSIFDTDDDAPAKLFGMKGLIPASLRWAGPNRLLATVGIPGTYTTLATVRLLGLDLTTGKIELLDKNSRGILGGNVLYVEPAGSYVVVASQDSIFTTPSVKRIDLATGVVTRIEPARPDVWDWFADGRGVVRAGVAYSGQKWTMWYRATAGAPLKPIRSPRPGKESGDGVDRGAIDGVRFLDDLDNGIIVANSKTGRFAAYRYNFATGAIGDAVYEDPRVDLTRLVTDPIDGGVAGVAYTDDRYRVAWFDPAMKAIQARVERALPGREIAFQGASSDGNRVLLWAGAADDPGTYYLYDRAAKTMRPLLRPYEKLDGVTLAPVAPIRYAARDGLEINGYLTLPPGRTAKGLPLIVMPHGGPHARDTWDFDPYVQFLASRGYVVLQPNFRGSTGYGKAFVEKGYGQWGRAMQDDVDDGVDWLIASGRVDARRVCIMGASYGGYAALWGAIRNPDRYRCAVSLAGVTDLPDMLRFDRKTFSAPRYFRAWQAKVKGEDDIDLNAVSPLKQAARLRIPVLVAHGEKDDNVPPRQGHRMVAALTAAGAPVESVFYPQAGHGLQSVEDNVDFLTRLEKFLAKNNPA